MPYWWRPDWEIDDTVAETQEAMAEASAVILDGFRLRSDARIVRWPDRYMDDRGREFWGRVLALIPERPEAFALANPTPTSESGVFPWRARDGQNVNSFSPVSER